MNRKSRTQSVVSVPTTAGFEGVRTAVVSAVHETHVTVRLVGEPHSPKVEARLATSGVYSPREGDRVVVAASPDEVYLIGVVHAAAPKTAHLDDGTSVHISENRVDIEDKRGNLVARYRDGAVYVEAGRGDLILGAPDGKVAISAGADIEFNAGRDVTHKARRNLTLLAGEVESGTSVALAPGAAELRAPQVTVKAHRAKVTVSDATLIARRIHTTATHLKQDIERLEVTANQILESAVDTFREVKDLSESRIGRAKTIVSGLFSLLSKQTDMVSEDETSIDGKRVLLG